MPQTAETGYTMRRLVKSMEDVRVMYDGTVRNAQNEIIQYAYGEDGMDPCTLEFQSLVSQLDMFKYNPNELEEQYYRVQASMPFIDNTKFIQILQKEWSQIDEDAIFIDRKYFKNSKRHQVQSPIHWDRLIARINNQKSRKYQHMEECRNPLLNSVYIITQVDLLIQRLKPCKLFQILIRQFVHSHRVIYEFKFSLIDFHRYLEAIEHRFVESKINPGEMVGCIAAQSIGEPAQQMTLSKFLFFSF